MRTITEPKMLLTCTEVLELIGVWETYANLQAESDGLTQEEKLAAINRYLYYKNLATIKLRKLTKQIWSN